MRKLNALKSVLVYALHSLEKLPRPCSISGVCAKIKKKNLAVFLLNFQLFIKLVTIMRFKSNMLRFARLRVSNEIPTSYCPSYRSSLPYCQKTRRANFHRTLLWPTSDYQARSPWTEIGGNGARSGLYGGCKRTSHPSSRSFWRVTKDVCGLALS